jgi:predicted porin
MQKKIIALAVAAAFSAPAFAEEAVSTTKVSFYGILDAAVANISAGGQKSDLIAISGGLSGSRLGVKVSEDLADGLKASGVVEYGIDTEDAVTLSIVRQKMLAVAGGFGTVATGYLQTTGFDFGIKFDPTGGSSISPLQSLTSANFLIGSGAVAKRAQRAIAYISPDISGLTVAVNYSTALIGSGNLGVASNATTGLKASAMLLSGTYTAGPLAAGVVYAKTSNDDSTPVLANVTNNSSEIALGGSYDLGVAKLMATYQSNKVKNATGDNKAMSLSGVIPVGTNAVALTYAKNTIGSTTADDNGSGLTLGYLHNLSKMTTAYAAYSTVKNGSASRAYSVANNAVANANLDLGGSSTLIAAGLRVKF